MTGFGVYRPLLSLRFLMGKAHPTWLSLRLGWNDGLLVFGLTGWASIMPLTKLKGSHRAHRERRQNWLFYKLKTPCSLWAPCENKFAWEWWRCGFIRLIGFSVVHWLSGWSGFGLVPKPLAWTILFLWFFGFFLVAFFFQCFGGFLFNFFFCVLCFWHGWLLLLGNVQQKFCLMRPLHQLVLMKKPL